MGEIVDADNASLPTVSTGGNVCMYVWSHICSESMDQPGKVANPAICQLNRENSYFPVRVRA